MSPDLSPVSGGPLTPAATILVLRDSPSLEVLMVERHHQIDFAAGALVFPGGKVCQEDHAPEWSDLVQGGATLEPGEQAFRIAAIREAFEEAGLLLARHLTGGDALVAPEDIESLQPLRLGVARGEISFLGMVRMSGFQLALDVLVPFAHWITPLGMPKRFDTRFYVAVAPEAQIAAFDGHEAVDAVWIAPVDALAAASEGRRTIIFPTRLNIELLSRSGTSAAALRDAQARTIVTVTPSIELREGQAWLTIPAEAGYAVTEEALEGNRP